MTDKIKLSCQEDKLFILIKKIAAELRREEIGSRKHILVLVRNSN